MLHHSLEAHVLRSDNSKLAADCRAEIKDLNRRVAKLGRRDYAERRQLRAELRVLSKEERQRSKKAVFEVLDGAQVVCCTLSGVGAWNLASQVFDVVFIDEVRQSVCRSSVRYYCQLT